MDRPSGQSQPAQTPTPGHRDMMFCHECHDEWYRDEGGLTCPECGSDFTEIIENDNDPRDPDHDDDEENDPIPSLRAAPPLHPLHDHHPWQNNDDPEEGDISGMQWRQLGPGRFAVSMHRTVSPATGGGAEATSAIGSFATLLNTVIAGGGLAQQAQQAQQTQQTHQGNQEGGRGTPGASAGSGTLPGGHRFTYSSTARLVPRDTDRPGNLQPQDELNNVLVGIMAAFGDPHIHDQGLDHGADDHIHGMPFNPFMNLIAQMIPGHGQAGDFVYSQEALDRIVSRLMEQTSTSTAPGPAPQSEIDALPRKPVTVDMLGSEGRAECSICMDEVNIGEQVTELPCHHWFHHQCVAAWLAEHDTCPHCRKGISKSSSNENGNGQASGGGGGSGGDPNRPMPGAFASGEGTFADPFVVHESSSQNGQGRTDGSSRPGSADETGSGGFGERLRRGLFGPPR